jgi:cold-inducible RNA-binding protein
MFISNKYNKERSMRLYISNLSQQTTETDVEQAFAAFGNVASAAIIKDKVSGESRGFGFVEMPDTGQAQAAMAGLAGKDLLGQALAVNEARAKR